MNKLQQILASEGLAKESRASNRALGKDIKAIYAKARSDAEDLIWQAMREVDSTSEEWESLRQLDAKLQEIERFIGRAIAS